MAQQQKQQQKEEKPLQHTAFSHRHIGPREEEKAEMLKKIGFKVSLFLFLSLSLYSTLTLLAISAQKISVRQEGALWR